MLFKKEEYRLQFKVRVKLLYEMVKDNNIKSQIPYIRSTLINNVNKMIHPFHQNSVKLILEIIDYLIINEHRIALLNLQYNDLLDIIEATATEYINHYEEQGCMILLEGSRNKFIDDPIFNTIVEYEDLAM